MDAEPIGESALAEMLGVSRSVLQAARDSLRIGDAILVKKKNGAVAYLPEAVEALRAHFAVPLPAPQKKELPAARLVTLTVTRPARQNRHVVFAVEKTDGAAGAEIAVRVRDSHLFVRGQEIQARLDGNLAWLHGPPPRSRGRNALQRSAVPPR